MAGGGAIVGTIPEPEFPAEKEEFPPAVQGFALKELGNAGNIDEDEGNTPLLRMAGAVKPVADEGWRGG